MEKLTSISEHSNFLQNLVITISEKWYYHRKRVEFGRQTLNISFFVPAKLVDGEWVVLEHKQNEYLSSLKPHERIEYETSLSNVLFEGFVYDSIMEYCHNNDISFDEEYINNKTIEDLVKYNLTLTTTSKKQIGL